MNSCLRNLKKDKLCCGRAFFVLNVDKKIKLSYVAGSKNELLI